MDVDYADIALLYDTIYGGYISKDSYIKQSSSSICRKKCDIKVKEAIDNQYLDPVFCDRLKHSVGLRYVVASGFHEAFLLRCEKRGNNFIMTLDCENALCMGIVGVKDPNRISLIFKDISKVENPFRKSEISVTSPKASYVEEKIYCLDNGDLVFHFKFFVIKRSSFRIKVLRIIAKDIVIE